MPHESVRHSAITSGVADLVGDLSDLVQKEARLARMELGAVVSRGIQAGVRFGVAAFLGLVATLVLVEFAIFAIAFYAQIALHWSCLIVAAVLLALAGICFLWGRAQLPTEDNVAPRSVRQWNENMKIAREPLR